MGVQRGARGSHGPRSSAIPESSGSALFDLIKICSVIGGVVISNHYVWRRLHFYLFGEIPDYTKAVLFLVIWLLALSGMIAAAWCRSLGVRGAYALLLAAFGLANDLHFRIMGEGINITVLEMVANNLQLAGQAGSSYLRMVLPALAGAAFLALGILLPTGERFRRYATPLAAWPFFAALLVAVPILRNPYYTGGWPGQFVMPSVLARYLLFRPDFSKDDLPVPGPRAGVGARHVVLIIDESVRGDFLDLNVDRGTTPWLAGREGMINFGLASSSHNCSTWSNAILRNGGNPSRLVQGVRTILNNPGIWKYAKEAGYRTVYIDGQMPPGTLHSYMTDEEREWIDDFHYMSEIPVPPHARDVEAAKVIRGYLRLRVPSLIVFNKYGVHYHYEHSYPPDREVFRPHLAKDEPPRDRVHVLNSYRNGVRWGVDHFFRNLLTGADLSDAVIVYTSDHGQNLLDDGKPATHCRVVNAIQQEAVVPLLVLTEISPWKEAFRSAAAKNFDRASHFQVFPTLLLLMGYEKEHVAERYYLSLLDPVADRVGFLSGDIFLNSYWNRIDLGQIRAESSMPDPSDGPAFPVSQAAVSPQAEGGPCP